MPQRERTRHVHGLHPYLGKFPPQLAEALLRRHFAPAAVVLDPFCGSGTTLVEAVAMGIGAVGIDISAFNVLLTREKLRAHEPAAATALGGLRRHGREAGRRPAYPPAAAGPSCALARRDGAARAVRLPRRDRCRRAWAGLAALVLSRSARSSRLVRHDSLDHAPSRRARRTGATSTGACARPTEGAAQFLRRYTTDVVRRVAAFAAVRGDAPWQVLHADARAPRCPRRSTASSPRRPTSACSTTTRSTRTPSSCSVSSRARPTRSARAAAGHGPRCSRRLLRGHERRPSRTSRARSRRARRS